MLRPRVIVVSVSLLATVIATPLTAQRLEVAARIGYSPPTGTQFQLADDYGTAVRSWDGGGVMIGAVASYWPLSHFGIQGSVDLRFTRHYATFVPGPNICSGLPCLNIVPELVDTSATQLVASLRLAARQALGHRLQLSASLGPAIIRFGDSEYGAGSRFDHFSLASRYEVGVAGGLSADYAFSSRLRLTVGTDDILLRVHPAAASEASSLGWTAVVTPQEHEFTFSAVVSVRVL